MSSDFITLYNK